MKKIILCLTLALMSATTMFAVKAKPGITQLQLVDGTIVSATLHGDEHFSYYSLLDGTPLKKSDNGKYEINLYRDAQCPKSYSYQYPQD